MKKWIAAALALLMAVSAAGCGSQEPRLSPEDPVVLTMWHVYGEQADSPMNRLVEEFNETVGLEKGIIVDVTVMSNSAEIGRKLMAAKAGEPGEPDMPDLFFVHTGNAAALGAEDLLDWQDCFTPEELEHYVPEFLEEGMVGDRLSVFPVSKSTHLLFVNGTVFSRFSADTGVTYEDLATWEGFLDAAARYYEWSGGKAFCAMDYLMRCVDLSMLAQGHEFSLTEEGWYSLPDPVLEKTMMPFLQSLAQGHIAVSDLYANTQVMTGETAAGLGSSAAILYYNDVVTYPDNTTEPMDLHILPMPQPAGGEAKITQAGVGLAALKTTDLKAQAASVFAHWFTEPRRNLDFVAETGYMPVNIGSFDAMDGYPFSCVESARLFETLKASREAAVSVVEPSHPAYYGNVSEFYNQVRSIQKELKEGSSAAGAAETAAGLWELFSGI